MGNMKPKQSTCLLELRAVFCILATLCEAHVEAMTKTQRRCKKRRAKLFNLRFQKHTEKIRHFFTFVSLFIFGFPLRFSPKKITQLKILKS
jgi:tryptophanase